MVYLDTWRRSYDPTIEVAEYIAKPLGGGENFDVGHCWRREKPNGGYENGIFQRIRGSRGENQCVRLLSFQDVTRDDPTFEQRLLVLGAQVRLGSAGCSGWPQGHTIDTASTLVAAGLQNELAAVYSKGTYWLALKELLNLQ